MFLGQLVSFASPRDAQDAEISIIHQELSLMRDLNAAQNIFIGREPRLSFGVYSRLCLFIFLVR